MRTNGWLLYAGMLLFTAGTRLIPYAAKALGFDLEPTAWWYPWNFSPALAFFVFAGGTADRRLISLWWPLGAMLLSDMGIGALTGHWEWAFGPDRLPVYGSFLLVMALSGVVVRPQPGVSRAVPLAVIGELIFFAITNYGAFVQLAGKHYPDTVNGVILCYVAGIPFLIRGLLSSALYSYVLFQPFVLRQVMLEPAGSAAVGGVVVSR